MFTARLQCLDKQWFPDMKNEPIFPNNHFIEPNQGTTLRAPRQRIFPTINGNQQMIAADSIAEMIGDKEGETYESGKGAQRWQTM